MADFFKPVLAKINKDVEVDDEFQPLDPALFVATGQYESSERGSWQVCLLKAGSPVWATLMPHGVYYLSDSEHSSTCHAQVKAGDLVFPGPISSPAHKVKL